MTLSGSTTGLDTVAATGDVITQFVSLESFADSMLVSLPVAILLTLILATLLLRSFRYAVAAVIPIGFVVTGVYAFMTLSGYTINVVTATIAAIAVGVGIDFSTHLTARYREELELNPDRLEALRTRRSRNRRSPGPLGSDLGSWIHGDGLRPHTDLRHLRSAHRGDGGSGAPLGAGRTPERPTPRDTTPGEGDPARGPRRKGVGAGSIAVGFAD